MNEYEEIFKDPKKVQEFMNAPPPSEMMSSFVNYWLVSRDVVRNSVAFTYNWTLGLGGVLGAPINYQWSALPVNGP
jgi:hypothetical protein